jgi:SAM-dependent methyltransferase
MARWNHNIHYHRLVKRAMPSGCTSALDVGCGDGTLVRALAPRCGHVTGIDPHQPSLTEAGAESDGLENVSYLRGDFLTYPFPEGSFDFITAIASGHHMPLAAALSRMRSLLRPNGRLAIIGLARSDSLNDYAHDGVGFFATRALALWHGRWEHNSPVRDPDETYAEVRQIVEEQLPDARFQRLALFRYAVRWQKLG